jgi:hypothetical protein
MHPTIFIHAETGSSLTCVHCPGTLSESSMDYKQNSQAWGSGQTRYAVVGIGISSSTWFSDCVGCPGSSHGHTCLL